MKVIGGEVMAEYVKLEIPAELKEKQLKMLEKMSKSGKVKIGVNEVTKAVERGTAKLVIIAEDVQPAEIVMHLPVLCKEKNVPFTYANTKKELGEKMGIKVGTAALVVLDEGDSKKDFLDLVKKLGDLSK